MGLLHAQGTAILFDGAALGRFQKFTGSCGVGSKTINAMYAAEISAGAYLPAVEPTIRSQTLSMEALVEAVPPPEVVGSKAELSIAGSGWNIPLGLYLFLNYTIEGQVGEYLRLTFSFTRSSYQ